MRFFYIYFFAGFAFSLESRWTPADREGDGQLPLSEKYRKNLRKLCELIGSNQSLPADILASKSHLEKECAKLRRDDGISSNGFAKISLFNKKSLLFLSIIIGSGGVYWLYSTLDYRTIKRIILFPFVIQGKNSNTDDHRRRADIAREARIKRFGENAHGDNN